MIFSNQLVTVRSCKGVGGLSFAQADGAGAVVICADRTRTGFSSWDSSTGQLLWSSVDAFPPALGIATVELTGGRAALAASEEYEMSIWDAFTGEEIASNYESDTVWDLACCTLRCGTQFLIGAGNSRVVYRWVAATGEMYGHPLVGHEAPVRAVTSFEGSAERRIIASGDEFGIIRRWDADSGELIGEPIVGPPSHIWHLLTVAAADDRLLLVAVTADGWMLRWDAVSGRPVGEKIFMGHESTTAVCGILVDRDAAVLTANSHGLIRQWDPLSGTESQLPMTGAFIATLPLGDGGALFATGLEAGEIIIRRVIGLHS